MSLIRPIIDDLQLTSEQIRRQLNDHPIFAFARARIAEAQEALRYFDEGRCDEKPPAPAGEFVTVPIADATATNVDASHTDHPPSEDRPSADTGEPVTVPVADATVTDVNATDHPSSENTPSADAGEAVKVPVADAMVADVNASHAAPSDTP